MDTDLKERNTIAQGTDVSIMNSFHSPPVAQAIIGITHIPDVQPTNCSIAIRALCEADDISIPAIQYCFVNFNMYFSRKIHRIKTRVCAFRTRQSL